MFTTLSTVYWTISVSSSSPAERNKHGKAFERFVHDNCKDLKKTLPVEWKRVVDSAAAGNLIGKADGDFEFTVNSGMFAQPFRFRIECKASVEHETLATGFRSLIKDHQNAQMLLALRAGICGVYLFHSVQNDEIEVWFARPLAAAYHLKRQPFYGRPAYVISSTNFPHFIKLWATKPAEVLAELLKSENRPVRSDA